MAKAVERQNSLVWLQGLVCGAVAAIAPGTALLLVVLLAPGLLALVLDREPGRPVARAVLLFGLAGSVQPVYALWSNGQSVTAALALLGDVATIGTAWSANAAGWLLAELAPIAARLVLDMLARSRAAQLRAERTRLSEAWGFDDAGAG